ncbi:MAG: hypothetical protein V4671_11795, partial [Armatimonadota bacterium]
MQLRRMVDIYRMALEGKSKGVPVYVGAATNASGFILSPETKTAYGFLLASLSLDENTKRAATIHSTTGFMPWDERLPINTSRPSWAAEGTWRVTGVIIYPDQSQRDKDVVVGWETEMHCDPFRKSCVVTRFTNRPLPYTAAPPDVTTAAE